MNWTPEADQVLRRIAREGGSFTDAAAQLGCGRNAVAGRSRRQGIPFVSAERGRAEKVSDGIRRTWTDPVVRENRLSGMRNAVLRRAVFG